MTTRLARGAMLGLLGLSAVAPLLLLLLVSLGRDWFFPALLPPRLEPGPWRELVGLDATGGGARLARAAASSVVLAVATGAIAASIALPIGRALDGLRGTWRAVGAAAAFLPVAAPPIALGVGLQFSLLRVGLGGSHTGVLVAHLVPAVGYTSLFFLGIHSTYDRRHEEDARVLGATARQWVARVTLPMMRRPLLEAFALGFLVSWAQVPLTLLVGQGIVSTLSVEVLTFVQAGQDRYAAAGALLLIVPAMAMLGVVAVAIRRAGVG